MKIFVALFRGINVGGRNILPMKELVKLFEKNSCIDVKTYIQSGNVIFRSANEPKGISLLLEKKFGFKPEILFLEKKQFLTSVENNSYQSPLGKTLHFYFCKNIPQPDLEKMAALKSETEQYKIIDKVFYLHAPEGIGRSKLVANLEKCLGVPATGRNFNTIKKLVDMLDNF